MSRPPSQRKRLHPKVTIALELRAQIRSTMHDVQHAGRHVDSTRVLLGRLALVSSAEVRSVRDVQSSCGPNKPSRAEPHAQTHAAIPTRSCRPAWHADPSRARKPPPSQKRIQGLGFRV